MVDRDFGNWLAGFIDGEGCFYISRDNARATYRPRFSMALRIDDRPILDECKSRTSIGTIHEYQGQSGQRVARWMVQSYADVAALIALLDRFPLRAKKKRDYEIWRKAALTVAGSVQTGCAPKNDEIKAQMQAFKDELFVARREGLL